ncbi:MAG: SPOR domain-containing protein [Novosphingobium sp.]|nr:SPOR domain-containing protein [Novosphingobium sp.]
MVMRAIFGKRMIAAVALLAASPSLADVKAGVDAWSRGNYSAAIKQWKGPAEKGDADAQFNLAQAYKLGRGVERDLAKAEELFAKAAAQGHLQASDNYGLLLFQRGERGKALPFVEAAAGRGDPRAQYLLGLAYFNGDLVTKDWVRAYALVSLAQQSGLPQAVPALAEMDKFIPIEQRQASVPVATKLAAEAQASRHVQIAAADLDGGARPAGASGVASSMGSAVAAAAPAIPRMPVIASAKDELSRATPANAGADYARPAPRVAAAPVRPAPKPAVTAAPAAKPAASTDGDWRLQLGAFGVAGNADRLWNRVSSRPELSGHGKVLVPAGRVTKLQAGGFASQADANAACKRLSASGFECIAVRK